MKWKLRMQKMLKDLSKMRFGHLVVRHKAIREKSRTRWVCVCDCGNETIARSEYLQCGKTRSCGCNSKIQRHGMAKTKLYGVWSSMKARCSNKNTKSYLDYGARGIKLCGEWKSPSVFFEWALNNGYQEGLELDRIDNEGDYEPSNCRFISKTRNIRNRRNTVMLEIGGCTKPLPEWAEEYEIKKSTLYARFKKGINGRDLLKPIKLEDPNNEQSGAL